MAEAKQEQKVNENDGESTKCALLVVDIQKQYYTVYPKVKKGFPDFEKNVVSLLKGSRELAKKKQLEIIHIREIDEVGKSSWIDWWEAMNPGHTVELAKGTCEEFGKMLDDETLITKTSWDAFLDTKLDEYLKQIKVTTLYMCGIATHQCVANSAMSAFNHGYKVHLIRDCCASDNATMHNQILQILHGSQAKVVSLEEYFKAFGSDGK
eukprot:144016_1